ncbi:hypothetical protein B0A49_13090 [Cryomyces minteri]|uniref:Metallo-beta-lactamase domain-containing protein n=1 Tax=Cryomyces minteri TaxID=331657 RepID=A0A4U0V698_9PEZI|nr:hypothetical protein B0A49_13090 [Cryomyces minteri]
MHSWSLALAFGLFSGVYAHVVAPRDPQSSTAASINVPTYASIDAASALGAKIGPSGYYIEDFGGGAYMVTDGSYQSLVLVSIDGVIVVDAPPSIGHKLLYAIGNITNASVTHLVYTHNHADHIGGAIIFDPAVEIVAHYETAQLLAQVNDTNRPPPTQTRVVNHPSNPDEFRIYAGRDGFY